MERLGLPAESFPYADEELQAHGLQMTPAADALLLGRITYEGMARAWLARGGDPFADHVNSITKYVVASQPAGGRVASSAAPGAASTAARSTAGRDVGQPGTRS